MMLDICKKLVQEALCQGADAADCIASATEGISADILSGIWRWTWGLIVLGEVYVLFYALSGYKIK